MQIISVEKYVCTDGWHAATLFSLNGHLPWDLYIFKNGIPEEGRRYIGKSAALNFMRQYVPYHEWKPSD